MKLKLPEIEHCNWYPIEGIAAFIDKISERPMHINNHETKEEFEGPKIIFTRAAVKNALPTLLGMGLCCQPAVPEHRVPRSNCGVVTEAWIDGDKLMIRGGIYGLQFPEVIAALDEGGIGLCVGFQDCVIDRQHLPESIEIRHMTFTELKLLHSFVTSFDNTNVWLTGRRSYVDPTDTEQFENQRKQRAALIEAA
jgi:hypothetical protein